MASEAPDWFQSLRKAHPKYMDALERLGDTVRREGPLDVKMGHLVQLAGAAAIRSEGAVHSHTRRALDAGASVEEIKHTLMLLTSTIGFPDVSAALSWVEDVTKT